MKVTNAVGANAAAGSFICRDDIIRLCPGPDCPLPVVIDSVDAAVAFCECNKEDVPKIASALPQPRSTPARRSTPSRNVSGSAAA